MMANKLQKNKVVKTCTLQASVTGDLMKEEAALVSINSLLIHCYTHSNYDAKFFLLFASDFVPLASIQSSTTPDKNPKIKR